MATISKRASHAPLSPIRKLVPFSEKAKAKGVKVYHLNIGQPDFKLPAKIQSALKKVASLDYLPYANSLGMTDMLVAWQKYYQQIGIPVTRDEIIVTSGGSEALILAIAAVCDPKDEVVTFEPFYANYAGFANLLGSKVVPVALDEKTGYHLPPVKTIEKAINNKTKALLVTNPNNPTGTVFTKKELLSILALAKKHDLFVIADETYRGISFGENKCFSLLDLAHGKEKGRIIITDSVSKRLNACGARLGAIITKNKAVFGAINAYCQARLSSPTIEQVIVAPMLADSIGYVEKLAVEYEKRRDAFIGTLEKELHIKIHRPEGAFYTMVKLPVADTDTFASWMLTDFSLHNETVMVAPGSGFYATPGKGKSEVRVAYVLNEKDLRKAAHILAEGVRKYTSVTSLGFS